MQISTCLDWSLNYFIKIEHAILLYSRVIDTIFGQHIYFIAIYILECLGVVL